MRRMRERSGSRARSLRVLPIVWGAACCLALLLFGGWQPLYLEAAGGIGLVAAVTAAVAESAASLDYRFRWRWLRLAWSVPHRTVVDFAILTRELVRALLRRRPPTGVFRAKPFDAARSPGWRAFIGVAAGYTPNAYVVEVDPDRGRVLVHDLVPNERSESPA